MVQKVGALQKFARKAKKHTTKNEEKNAAYKLEPGSDHHKRQMEIDNIQMKNKNEKRTRAGHIMDRSDYEWAKTLN